MPPPSVHHTDKKDPARLWRRQDFASSGAGPELDREIARRVLGRPATEDPPPLSTDDAAATALADRLAARSGWWFEVTHRRGVWSAMWIEPPRGAAERPRRILSLITATGPTPALAICRSLLRASRCPRWPGARETGSEPGVAAARSA
jgi:hypothetical protein